MPRPAKGPRLYLRRGRLDGRTGRPLPDLYYIRDGARELGTGCGPDRLPGAEKALAAYIAEKWAPPRRSGTELGDPAAVLVAEVLALYLTERGPSVDDPSGLVARVSALLAWWNGKTVAEVRRSTCQAYLAERITQPIRSARTEAARKRLMGGAGVRRELEDLSAAIGHWHGEHALTARPKVWLPEKRESPRDALSRAQAADLLRAALGKRKGPDGRWRRLAGSAPANRAHLRRFILIGLYTGTRSGVINRLLWTEAGAHPWVDLEAGVIYRRGRDEREHRTKRRPLVKIPRRLDAHLARWRRLDAAWRARLLEADVDADPPMTVLHHGANPLAGRMRRAFASAVADAGLPAEITPHWLRHTCATWLMEGGVMPWEAAGFTGMTVATLEKHYGHHRPDHQASARAAIGRH